MKKPNQPSIRLIMKDGRSVTVYRPESPADVEQQSDIPAYVLAVLAFAPCSGGALRWSKFTLDVFKQLQRQFGDTMLRECLRDLLADISDGFRATNPYGLLVSRVRKYANGGDVIQL